MVKHDEVRREEGIKYVRLAEIDTQTVREHDNDFERRWQTKASLRKETYFYRANKLWMNSKQFQNNVQRTN